MIDEIELFGQNLVKLEQPNTDQNQVLNELSDLIRQSQSLRENGTFYKI